jgi:TRAP-type C4-dicarboxylate transport system substrate-binding protein
MGPTSAVAPVASVGSVGFAFKDWPMARAATNGGIGALVRRELEAKGIVLMEQSWAAGFQQIMTSNRAVRSADDLSGLKLRVPIGPINVDMFKSLGAAPVSVNVTEVYTSIQTHLVDGTTGALLDLYARKTFEVTKYLGFTNHQFGFYFLWINSDVWKSLPADLQDIVRRNANRAGKRAERIAELQAIAATDVMARSGMQVTQTETDSFRARLGTYYAHWKSEFGPAAWSTLEQYVGRLG